MTKEEAYNKMQEGYPVSHKNFSPDEFLWMDDNYIIKDEEGNDFENAWDVNKTDEWNTNWYIYKKQNKIIKRKAIPFKRKEEYKIEEKQYISHMQGADCAGKEYCLQYSILGESACLLCDCTDEQRALPFSSNPLLQVSNNTDFIVDENEIKTFKSKNKLLRKIKNIFRRKK